MSKLTAEDFLDWFKLKPPSIQPPKLPKLRLPRDGRRMREEKRFMPLPLYRCRELGQLYVQQYQEQHLQEAYQNFATTCEGSHGTACSSNQASVCGSAYSAVTDTTCHTDGCSSHHTAHSTSTTTTTTNNTMVTNKESNDGGPSTVNNSDDDDTDSVHTMNDSDTCTLDGTENVETMTEGSLVGMDEDTIRGSLVGGATRGPALSEGTTAMQEQQLNVYQQYNFTHFNEEVTKLPVYNYKKEILMKIVNYQVVVIEGRTGCGKSTQVAQFILDQAAAEGRYVNIVVTQPRKIAAVTLAKRVCEERHWELGSLVGYQVGLDNCTSEDTRLCYLTTEVLVQKIISQQSMNAFTHILLDEVHERDQHTDFALLLVKKLLNTVSRAVKVILMSATIDVNKFARYFATPVMGHLLPAPVVSVSDPTQYNTRIYYMEQLAPIFRDKIGCMKDEPDLEVDSNLCELVVDVVQRCDLMETNADTHAPVTRGAVLVFVPGIMEIENMVTKMRACADQYKWIIFPLHSSITIEEQKEAFGRSMPGYRKVIVATNIAESSITVPDVRYVVDLCMTKVLHCDPVTNFTCLKLDWASKASCDQRAGRAGRTSNGRVYRMVTHRFYERLASYSTPELVRCPLSIAVLKTKRLDMGEPASLLALALDPPNLADIARTILTLKQLGCLSVSSGRRVSVLDGELTHLGYIAAQLPLDPHLSKLIVLGQALGCLREVIIIAAGLSLKSFHSKPFQDELNAHLSKMSWAYGSFSDCIALLNAYDVWQSLHCRQAFRERGSRVRTTGGIREDCGGAPSSRGNKGGERQGPGGVTSAETLWAKQSYVQLQQLREVHKLVEELTDRLKQLHVTPSNLQRPSTDNQETILKLCIAGAFYPHYFRRNNNPDRERETSEELCGHDPYSTVIIKRLPQQASVLYEQQIRDMFKECATDIAIEIENSTAYVMFRRPRGGDSSSHGHVKSIPGEFPTAMYLALKMVQVPRIRDTLYINLYSSDDTERQLSLLNEKHEAAMQGASLDMSSTANTSLSRTLSCLSIDSSHTSATTPHSYSRVLRYGCRRVLSTNAAGLKPPELPSYSQITWRIQVVHVESAGRLWALSEDNASIEQLHFVLSTIALALDNGDVEGFDPSLTRDSLPLGEPVLAPFTSSDKGGKTTYQRAQIEELRNFSRSTSDGSSDDKLVQVFYVDHGCTARVPIASLKQMPHSLLSVPQLAVECCLAEIRPASSSCDGAAWSEEANNFARAKLTNNSFLVKVYSYVHGVMRIQLYDKNPATSQLRCFNDVLVERRFAVRAQETLQSQNDNRCRRDYLYSAGGSYTPAPIPPPHRGYGAGLSGGASVVSTLSLASAISTTSLVSDADKQQTMKPTKNKCKVLGPYSPLQLRFSSLYRATECKIVRVEQASVNSTALDMEPQNPHDRLLVASFVSLSGNENKLMARNTTLMPPVPGLLSICCLTFCHVANMRVSEDGCEYTGAIIGLGADPSTGHPLYPDEDIELPFDVLFTNSDLEQINKVRYMLSSLISSPPGETGALDPATRAARQTTLRQTIVQLLDESRCYKKPVYCSTPYRWNVVSSDRLLQPMGSEEEQLQQAPVYPLHYGVSLAPHTAQSLLERTKALVRSHKKLLTNEKARLDKGSRVWERCYACNELLGTVQDVMEHLESVHHAQRVHKLEALLLQE